MKRPSRPRPPRPRAVDPMTAVDLETLRSIIHSMSDGVVVADRKGRFLLWNKAAERMAGIGRTDAPPERWTSTYGIYLPDGITPFPTEDLPLVRAIRGEVTDDIEMIVR